MPNRTVLLGVFLVGVAAGYTLARKGKSLKNKRFLRDTFENLMNLAA